MKCPYCFSPDIKVISSYPMRDVVVIECQNCHKTAELDVENMQADTDVPRKP